ncbi:MAG: hypothetical protein ACI4JQ_02170 [Ruminococcus sp.]
MMMFTNASCTLFHKGIDAAARLPTWEPESIEAVYWEDNAGQSLVSNQNGNHEMKQNNSVFVMIPKAYVPEQMPKRGDLIALGTDAGQQDAHTIMSVENFLYGSEAVQHIEVTAV